LNAIPPLNFRNLEFGIWFAENILFLVTVTLAYATWI